MANAITNKTQVYMAHDWPSEWRECSETSALITTKSQHSMRSVQSCHQKYSLLRHGQTFPSACLLQSSPEGVHFSQQLAVSSKQPADDWKAEAVKLLASANPRKHAARDIHEYWNVAINKPVAHWCQTETNQHANLCAMAHKYINNSLNCLSKIRC